MKKRPTINTIAQQAGVSRGTVDRVLNNRGHVREDVKKHIIDVANAMGYLSPTDRHSQNVNKEPIPPLQLGIILPPWDNFFMSEIQRGIESAKKELVFFNATVDTIFAKTEMPHETISLIDSLLEKGVKGIALCCADSPEIVDKINQLSQMDIPVVTYNSDISQSRRICFVGQNEIQAGKIAGQIMGSYLHPEDKIALVIGNPSFAGHALRRQGFMERLEQLGFSSKLLYDINTYNNYYITHQEISDLIKQHPDLAGIYMANQSVAGACAAVKDSGKKGQIFIVAHDMSPSHTFLLKDDSVNFVISQDIFSQGKESLLLLCKYIAIRKLPTGDMFYSDIHIECSQSI